MIYIPPGTIFQCEFSGDVYFGIRLTVLGNSLFYMYVYALYTIFQCEFSCNSYYVMWWLYMEQYMIWSSSGVIFHFTFSGNGNYVIRRPYCHKIWYGHHQVRFFISLSVAMVIMSSRDYIVAKYDMVIIGCHFSFHIQWW